MEAPHGSSSPLPTPDVPTAVLSALSGLRSPVMLAHVVPDADALGSMLAMALAWRSSECRPVVSLPEGSLSQRLRFLVEWAQPRIATPDDFTSADGFVALDTAKQSRCNVGKALKETDWRRDRPLVNIDHHTTNTQYGSVNWVVSDAGSTAELIYYLLRAADRPVTPVIASLLYAGIQTDTLGFSLPTTQSWALAAAAHLVQDGANVVELGERMYRSQSQSEFNLLRIVYDHTKVTADGRLAYSYAGYDDIHNAGCTAADIDDQINVPRSLEGVTLAMLFTEGRKGKTRINFRSSGSVTVSELAAEFDGGGHNQAAGAILDCGIEEAMERVLPRAIEHLKRFES